MTESSTTYITLREEEKEILNKYVDQYWGDKSRITSGAAIRHLAESALERAEGSE